MHGQCQTFSCATDVKLHDHDIPLLPQCSCDLEQQCPTFLNHPNRKWERTQYGDLTNLLVYFCRFRVGTVLSGVSCSSQN